LDFLDSLDSLYRDILNTPYPNPEIEKDFPDPVLRGAQFAPFAALTGHDEAIEETARLTDGKVLLLVNEREYLDFITALDEHPEIETVYIVTDSDAGYRDMIAGLEDKNTYQLYRDYLDNFRINSARR